MVSVDKVELPKGWEIEENGTIHCGWDAVWFEGDNMVVGGYSDATAIPLEVALVAVEREIARRAAEKKDSTSG